MDFANSRWLLSWVLGAALVGGCAGAGEPELLAEAARSGPAVDLPERSAPRELAEPALTSRSIPSHLTCVSSVDAGEQDLVPQVWRVELSLEPGAASLAAARGPQFPGRVGGQWLAVPRAEARPAQVFAGRRLVV